MQIRILFIALAISFSTMLFAQPNGGFEVWQTEFGYETPQDWQTVNVLSLLNYPICVTKATGVDKYSGLYSIKITSVDFSGNPTLMFQDSSETIPDTICSCFLGRITVSPITYREGFPYQGRPEKLQFYYKYSPVDNDKGLVEVLLKKYNNSHVDTIANTQVDVVSTPTWSLMEIPLDYQNDTALPDSVVIAFLSSAKPNTGLARIGSTLWVDDVSFSGWVGIKENQAIADKIKIFPNPAQEQITIETELQNVHSVVISDYTGKKMGEYTITNKSTPIDTRAFPAATYFYNVRDKNKKTLTAGKFVVVK